ncbi:MAG: ATP synthase subunit I [Desulfobacterota bacterium]|nr:ATP synthase subunit I [Thermodesulfobacteriota bacterium]MDW8002600.1 ATP synthase subunit I [Deltaproteobacteria bacterium]
MKEEIVRDIEKINVGILTIGSIVILLIFQDYRYFLSFALGSAMMSLNFRFLKSIILRSLADSKIEKKGLLIKLPLKFFGLLFAVSLVIVYGDVDILYFVLGLSTVFFSIILSQIPLIKLLFEGGRHKDGT